jgi:hypothetical protein
MLNQSIDVLNIRQQTKNDLKYCGLFTIEDLHKCKLWKNSFWGMFIDAREEIEQALSKVREKNSMPFKDLPEGQTHCFDENEIKQQIWRVTFKTHWRTEVTIEVVEKEPISKQEAMIIAYADLRSFLNEGIMPETSRFCSKKGGKKNEQDGSKN